MSIVKVPIFPLTNIKCTDSGLLQPMVLPHKCKMTQYFP